jgi:hypothetical protein
LILSFQRRDPWVFNSGDVVVRIEALFLALSPCGAALSLDQRRRTGSFWSAESGPVWPVRLFQVQMSIIYLAALQMKLSGETWLQGTAVSYVLRLNDMQRWPTPDWYATNALIMNLVTWGTLAIELALAVLIWDRRFRPWVLAAGVVLHLMIDIHIQIGVFSYAMFVLYLAWISPEAISTLRWSTATSRACRTRSRAIDSVVASVAGNVADRRRTGLAGAVARRRPGTGERTPADERRPQDRGCA